ncbi:MAG: hypothetical protein J1E62_01760 [Lachnospiraceae bacterium]|nr:hypothetical protein [Lachnospiraceae bacterium]
MKIAFWSSVRGGDAGVTTNTACMAAMMTFYSGNKNMLLENHYSLRNIGDILLSPDRIECLREQGHYYHKYGMEHLLKELHSGNLGHKVVRQTAIPLLFDNLFYLPQSYIVNHDVFEYEFELVRKSLFQCLEDFSDILFIDTETNRNLSSAGILSEADIVVVNLIQNPEMIADFFENYHMGREKMLFLIGKYQQEHAWNLRRICYRFHIPRERIGVVPYHMELEEAMWNGRLLQFLNRNSSGKTDKETGYLMRQLKYGSAMLHNQIHILRSQKG